MVACEFAGKMQNGAPLLVGIFRQIHTSVPGVLAPFWLALELEAQPDEVGEHRLDLRLIDEDGRTMMEAVLGSVFRRREDLGPNFSYFAEQIFLRDTIQRAGVYRFDLLWRGEALAELRLEVISAG